MPHARLITENQLDDWVRGNSQKAQGIVVELIWRLVAASSPQPRERRFPLGDSIGQQGPDGILDAIIAFDPFVPEGNSFWEIGTNLDAGSKATEDYNGLKTTLNLSVRKNATFVFVTPLSGRRTWNEKAQNRWLKARKSKNEWRDIRIIDATKIIDWMSYFPAIERWLAGVMRIAEKGFDFPNDCWADLKAVGEPPPLRPSLFLSNREDLSKKVDAIFQAHRQGNSSLFQIDTHHRTQAINATVAHIAKLEQEHPGDVSGRTIIVRTLDTLEVLSELSEPHVFVVDADVETPDAERIFRRVQRNRHSVIHAGTPGGMPHGNRIALMNPKPHQIHAELTACGYPEARAHSLSNKCGNNLDVLLRLIQRISTNPAWAQTSESADLVILELLGAFHEGNPEDVRIAEELAGKALGEWTRNLKEVLSQQSAPLTYRSGLWKMSSRYEGWYSLGDRLFPKQLELFKKLTIRVLSEQSPAFDLPKEQRYLANIYGKTLIFSSALRHGLAETLALLGSHPQPLVNAPGASEHAANMAVREILTSSEWRLWGTLDGLLPLLAEASPDEFLGAVEKALDAEPCPFKELFQQEGADGLLGANYLSGLWWALETLAWDPNLLVRTTLVLGRLAAMDPGGNWSNRPSNSLVTIFLAWMPQTTASIEKRLLALQALRKEYPRVAWKLLLALLPNPHSISMGSRKPVWRSSIPDDWTFEVTTEDHWRQIDAYADMVVEMGIEDLSQLPELIAELDRMPEKAMKNLLDYLRSKAAKKLPESIREPMWSKLKQITTKHKAYRDADWAWPLELIVEVDAATDLLAPEDPLQKNRRLFANSDMDLFEDIDDWGEQQKTLEKWRQDAAREILNQGETTAIIRFAETVEAPDKVGASLGVIAPVTLDAEILPAFLRSETKSQALLAGGLVWGRHRVQGWAWVDQLNMSSWDVEDIIRLLSHLPFAEDAWTRAELLLGKNVSRFWAQVPVRPYWEGCDLNYAADRLLENGRPRAAIDCLYSLLHAKKTLDAVRISKVLLASVSSVEGRGAMDIFHATQLIKHLQEHGGVSDDELATIEWAYLVALNKHSSRTRPQKLFAKLASDAQFFTEVIRVVYRSKNPMQVSEESSEHKKSVAENGWRLLREWNRVPGMKAEGLDPAALKSWIEEATEECQKSGHLEVARSQIGHILMHAPSDPAGLWIHRAVAEILDAKGADDLRDGFHTEHLNSRGCHRVDPTGAPERTLFEEWKKKSDDLENAGFHRLADKTKKLAAYYAKEAQRVVDEHKHRDI